ncbi:MAG: ribbon-helix-helix protein, CopG family [Thermoplasmata archaeon]|nr:MAG: ribbon-helix-helix protein, CopG family [Thermoplasmata archaeon]
MATQVNIRLDEDLLEEIDALAKVMHITRTEYIKLKLSKGLQEDTLNMIEAIVLEYAKGRISEKELRELLGKDADDIKFIVQHIKKSKKKIDGKIKSGLL